MFYERFLHFLQHIFTFFHNITQSNRLFLVFYSYGKNRVYNQAEIPVIL